MAQEEDRFEFTFCAGVMLRRMAREFGIDSTDLDQLEKFGSVEKSAAQRSEASVLLGEFEVVLIQLSKFDNAARIADHCRRRFGKDLDLTKLPILGSDLEKLICKTQATIVKDALWRVAGDAGYQPRIVNHRNKALTWIRATHPTGCVLTAKIRRSLAPVSGAIIGTERHLVGLQIANMVSNLKVEGLVVSNVQYNRSNEEQFNELGNEFADNVEEIEARKHPRPAFSAHLLRRRG